jgi:hypothetical protein
LRWDVGGFVDEVILSTDGKKHPAVTIRRITFRAKGLAIAQIAGAAATLVSSCLSRANLSTRILVESGDYLIFNSAHTVFRVLAIDGEGADTVWHLLAYDEFFPDVESAEALLAGGGPLSVRKHIWLRSRVRAHTNRASQQSPTD